MKNITISSVGILFLLSIQLLALEDFPDLQIVDSGLNGLSAIYSPFTENISQSSGQSGVKLDLPFHAATGSPGEFRLPFRRHLIAIPPGAEVSLNINQLNTRQLSNVELERIPPDSNFTSLKEGSRQASPTQFITVSEPFRFRRYQVVEIVLRPALYNSAQRALTIVEQINFTLTFHGGSPTGIAEPHSQRLKSVILNYQQAKNWSIPPSRNSSSSLPEGLLFKMPVDEEGIYRITYADLEELNIEPADYPLDLVSIYNNGGRELLTFISAPTIDSLIENPIYIYDEDSDSTFDPEDYLLFYGKGTWGFEQISPGYFAHYNNSYTYDNIYWLELKQTGASGKRMLQFGAQGSYAETVQTTKARVYREDEKVIYAGSGFTSSGLEWYGDLFTSSMTRSYTHSFEDVESGYYKIKLRMKNIGSPLKIDVFWNNTLIGSVTSSNTYTFTGEDLTKEGLNSLKLQNVLNDYGSYGTAYFDWYEIEYCRYLMVENQFESAGILFESPLGSGIAYYDSLSGLSDSAFIFKITQFDDIQYTRGKRFKDDLSSTSAERYFACDEAAFRAVDDIYMYVPPQSDFIDLRTASNKAGYLFITHSDFYSGLDDIVNLWANQTGLLIKRVDIAQIFDQFSAGLYDPAAIRNFLRYAVDNWDIPPYFTALVGDGDYDFLNRTSGADKNWIPPYESGDTAYDDFYAYLHYIDNPEIALGRYTITSAGELAAVSDKILKYVSNPEFGPWRIRFTIVADDEYGEGGSTGFMDQDHVQQSEDLADYYLPKFLNTDKIYLTEYPVVPGAGGRQKPQAGEDLVESINQGAVMVNFFGHGNEWVWAHETVFSAERDLPLIDNGYKLAYFIALTCDWAYFDNPQKQSMPEMLLTMPGEGAVACIGASRPTGSTSNWNLAQNLYSEIFEDPLNPKSVGESLMNAKNIYGGDNSRKYHIIGDPMIAPCTPRNSGQLTALSPDSLFALNLMSLSGELYLENNPWINFDGSVYLDVKDAAVPITYQFANSSVTVDYELPGSTIFRGPFNAAGGSFNAQFVVPMDITYGGELGRLSVYFTDGIHDGCAYRDSVYIGAGGVELQDSDAPSAEVYFGDRAYRPGDPVSCSPVLIADLADSSGINLTGSAGHEIMLIADEDQEFDITEYFEYQTDSYTTGSLEHQLEYLAPGLHQMKLRAWDSFNHPYQIEFTIETADIEPGGDYLTDILNYPNPFADTTAFTFKILEPAEVEIKIYTVAGRLIKTLGPKYCTPVFVYDQFNWNARDQEGDRVANGVYLYKVKAQFSGETVSKVGRIIVMR